ncbi:MAG: imidazole glycerol phosphate synthase subunit HisF [Promethearchaeota archaeon]
MKKIIPAIDLYNGNVVRLYKGDFQKSTKYSTNALEILKHFLKQGVEQMHIINLNGAKSGKFENGPNFEIILSLIKECNKWGCKIQLGGGIRAERTIKELIDLGVYKIILGTIVTENPNLFQNIVKKYTNDISIALDILNNTLRVKGWIQDIKINLISHFKNLEYQGVSNFIITDISRDGTLNGPNVEMYRKLSNSKLSRTRIIASGGIRDLHDVDQVLRYADGVVIGKAIYNNNINVQQLKDLILRNDPTNLTKRIIPCLDVKDGRVVKGVQFNNLRDNGDPVELSKYYNAQGADELVFLDISATLENRASMIQVIEKVAQEVYIPFTVGGGIRKLGDISKIINAGAEKVSINTAAVDNPKIIRDGSEKFGSQSIVVAIDVKKKGKSWEVYIKSGTESTGLDALEWAKKVVENGAGELLVTSMDKDGTQTGYDLRLIKTLSKNISVPIIASGGAGNYDNFYQAINAGAEAVLAASLFHDKVIMINDLKEYLLKNDVKVRNSIQTSQFGCIL